MNATATNSSSTSASVAFSTKKSDTDPYLYQVGFGNRFASEAVPGTLPLGQNNPQKAKYGLYTEQITGTAFTAPRNRNQNAWLYRIYPSVMHDGFTALPDLPDLEHNFLTLNPRVCVSPTQFAWDPLEMPTEPTEFIEGIKTIAGVGEPTLREGVAVHVYVANSSMSNRAFVNADGDFLIVPVQGRLDVQTEFGKMMVRVGEIAVVQRGMRFKIILPDGPSRGYIHEVFSGHWELPELGPLGANGMANPRDFESPVASFDLDTTPWEIVYKFSGTLHAIKQQHTPFDVVAWHGNYAPYKYDLHKFIRVGSISKDHIDPSIFCVLTARSKYPDAALADFNVMAPRWDVAEQTFRPPYFHRNVAAEVMGVIYGTHGTATPGCMRVVNSMAPHGIDEGRYKETSEAPLGPMRIGEGILYFVFETGMPLALTRFAMDKGVARGPGNWSGMKAEFVDRLEEVNKDLVEAGLPMLRA